MPRYTITDPASGKTVTLTGDSPPTEAELSEIFGAVAAPAAERTDPEGSSVWRGIKGAASQLNPIAMVQGIGQAVAHPLNTAGALIGAQVDQGKQAWQMAKEGRYTEAAGHAGAAVLPLIGPAAANIGQKIADTGDIATGVGEGVGMIGGILAPGALAKVRGVNVPGVVRPNAAVTDALALAEKYDIPVDAALATGNKAIGALQSMTDKSLGGSLVAEPAQAAQAAKLATVGEQLAAKAHKGGLVTAEQSGQAVKDAVLAKLRGHAGEANTAYEQLRAIEADPIHRRTIHPEPVVPRENAKSMFAYSDKATPDDIFHGAWRDAKESGYKGSMTELRMEFDDKMRLAKSLKGETAQTAEEVGHDALLKAIRDLGGIKPFERDFKPGQPAQRLGGEYENLTQLFKNQKGANAIFRETGKDIDDIAGQLKHDPVWSSLVSDDPEALKGILEEIGVAKRDGTARTTPTDLQHYLKGVGVEPGIPWWEAPKQPVEMALPVDLRSVKTALQPLHDELMARYPVAKQEASSGLKALQNIVNGPDYAPLSQADANLGAIKTIARTDLPELATISQGTAKQAVNQLEQAVTATATEAGPHALDALTKGRAATVAKYDAGDVLDAIQGDHFEPVGAHRKLTAPADSAIAHLREVAKQAPAELPKIGRAVLDGLIEKAKSGETAFDHAQRIAADWQKLGPQTKLLLYKDPGYIHELDQFFKLAKMAAKNPNPSGTAHNLSVVAQAGALAASPALGPAAVAAAVGSQAGLAGLSKLFHSRAGVRLLTKGFRIPIGNTAGRAAWAAEVGALTTPSGSRSPAPEPVQ